jgi:periodic tryptophan protein 2
MFLTVKVSWRVFHTPMTFFTVSYRPDGKQLACSTLDGQIYFWDPIEGQLMWTIEGRRDIAGGRLVGDRRTTANSSSGKCFTSLSYSADGKLYFSRGQEQIHLHV